MAFVDKGRPPKGNRFLVCDNARRKLKCTRNYVRYDELETTILEKCHQLRPEEALPKADEQAQLCRALRQRIHATEGKLQDLDERIKNTIENLTRTKSKAVLDQLEPKVEELTSAKEDISNQLDDDYARLEQEESAVESLESWTDGLAALKQLLAKDDPEPRLRLRAHLRDLIDHVDVYPVGFESPWDDEVQCGEYVGRYMDELAGDGFPEALQDPEWHAFVAEVQNRRMSKEGRFYHVVLRSGAQAVLRPPGSLATEIAWNREAECKVSMPDWEQLANDFISNKVSGKQARTQVTRLTSCGRLPPRA